MGKIRKLTSVAAAAGICALMAASPAQAYVYATSALKIQDLVLGVGGANTTVNSYQFSLNNSATLDAGSQSTGAIVCNSTVPVLACNGVSPVLDALAVNAPGSTVSRTNNNFALLGENQVHTYSGADSVITTAQLVQDVPTNTQQVAESLLNINGFAQANALIQSTTSLTATVIVAGPTGSLSLTFLADPDTLASISGVAGTYLTQADLNTSFSISRTGGSLSWTPNGNGIGAGDCILTGNFVGVVTCTETADNADLNYNASTSDNPGADENSFELATVLASFGINVTGLSTGTYTIAFNAQTSTLITRNVVPEPGMIALLGAAMLGLGASRRRRQA